MITKILRGDTISYVSYEYQYNPHNPHNHNLYNSFITKERTKYFSVCNYSPCFPFRNYRGLIIDMTQPVFHVRMVLVEKVNKCFKT